MCKNVTYIDLLLLLSCISLVYGLVLANITTTNFLRDSEELVSINSIFKFGFFSVDNSTTNRYAGIWYNKNDSDDDILRHIWIANRDSPLNDSSGVLRVSEDGDLQLLNGQNDTVWSSNVTVNHEVDDLVAQLLDTGNLVLLSNVSRNIVWQSFDHLTNALLPFMQLSFDENTTTRRQLVSWKSASDPSTGRFTAGINRSTLSEVFVWDGDRPYWRSGPWNGHVFLGIPSMYYELVVGGFRLEIDRDGRTNMLFSPVNETFAEHYVLTYEGEIVHLAWDDRTENWIFAWKSLESECDIYGKCGVFGSCNSNNSQICRCLRGFEPTDNQEWGEGNWSSGCVRRTALQCGTLEGKEDGFLRLRNMKVPDNSEWLYADNEEHCKRQCLRNCSCLAYAYYLGIGCMIWSGSLIDIQEFSSVGVDLFIRLADADPELGKTLNSRC